MAEILSEAFPPLKTYCPILFPGELSPSGISAPQALFLALDCEEAFYGGAVGGGKTAALLMAALQYVDVPGYAALILRRTFKMLEQPNNVIPISSQWFATVPEKIRPLYSSADHEWRFPSGAVIRFGHLDNPNNEINYQGGGYHFVGFDELTHFEERSYEFIGFSRSRRPKIGPLSKVPMRIRSTANPGGPGHIWVQRRFIKERDREIAFIPAKVYDNPGIDTEDYVARLRKMRPATVKQLLDGDWDAFEGAAFQVTEDHLVPPVEIEDGWVKFESMDFGVANPTCVLAWAVDYDGNMIVFDSYYQGETLVSEHAKAIEAKRDLWGTSFCYADPSMWARTGGRTRWGDPASDITEFQALGISGLHPANNKRRPGRIRLLELLEPDPERPFPHWHPRHGEKGSPRLFIVQDNCPELVEQLKSAPLLGIDRGGTDGGEIVDPDWETQHGHACAAARYGALSWKEAADRPAVPIEDPKQALLVKVHENDKRELYRRDEITL